MASVATNAICNALFYHSTWHCMTPRFFSLWFPQCHLNCMCPWHALLLPVHTSIYIISPQLQAYDTCADLLLLHHLPLVKEANQCCQGKRLCIHLSISCVCVCVQAFPSFLHFPPFHFSWTCMYIPRPRFPSFLHLPTFPWLISILSVS